MERLTSSRLSAFAAGLMLVIRCLAAPGDLDPTFNASGLTNWIVTALAVQPDGKVIVGGQTGKRIIRLNPDGSTDLSFDPGPGGISCSVTGCVVKAIAVQPDGRLLVGGYFDSVNGTLRRSLARLNTNGTLDGTFDTGSGPNGVHAGFSPSISAIIVQSDGKVIVAGCFGRFNGTNWNNVARLNKDGSLDREFSPPFTNYSGYILGSVNCAAPQADGKLLVGCAAGIYRLNTDGTRDSSFAPPNWSYSFYNTLTIAAQPDGKVLVGGQWKPGVARLNQNGSLDLTFIPAHGIIGVGDGPTNIYCAALQSDGKLLIAGYFGSFDYSSQSCIARLNTNGSLDRTFDTHGRFGVPIRALAVEAGGKVLIGGELGQGLVRVFGHNSPQLNPPTRLPDGTVELTGNSATNARLRVEVSTNLLNWDSLDALTNTNGVFRQADIEATNFSRRFYRALWLP